MMTEARLRHRQFFSNFRKITEAAYLRVAIVGEINFPESALSRAPITVPFQCTERI
jgi:hypothetical protein